jgi:hypothetical protein
MREPSARCHPGLGLGGNAGDRRGTGQGELQRRERSTTLASAYLDFLKRMPRASFIFICTARVCRDADGDAIDDKLCLDPAAPAS